MTRRILVLVHLFAILLFHQATAQDGSKIIINGTILSSDDSPLPGVSVVEEGTSNGTITDVDGNYTLVVEGNSIILVSSIGFVSQEIDVDSRSTIDVILTEDLLVLAEVVAIGYGSQRRADLTGAISTIDADEINANVVSSLDQAIQGRMSGVSITSDSGEPGGGISVRIRGAGSFGYKEPLYVIDGLLINNFPGNSEITTSGGEGGQLSNPLSSINPNDIESINILKDASAAAIYGVRGANGVVIITTKSGTAGAPKVSVDAYMGVQTVTNRLKLLEGDDYASLITDAFTNKDATDDIPEAVTTASSIEGRSDWQDEFFKTGSIQSFNVNVSGGTDNATYNFSSGYFQQGGTTLGTGFNRISIRSKTKFDLGKVRIGESVTISRTETDRPPFESARTMLRMLVRHSPLVAIRNPDNDGGFGGPDNEFDGYNVANPIGLSTLQQNEVARTRIIGSVFAEWDIIEGLTYKLNVGADLLLGRGSHFAPSYSFSTDRAESLNSVRKFSSYEVSPLIENTLQYSGVFGDHDLTVLAGVTQQTYEFENQVSITEGTPNNSIKTLSAGTSSPAVAGGAQDWALRSYLGRVSYAFQGKYLVTANVRRDGSSRFTEDNRWGVFPLGGCGLALKR